MTQGEWPLLIAGVVVAVGLVWAASIVSRAILLAVTENREHEPHCHACKLAADEQKAIERKTAIALADQERRWEAEDRARRKETTTALALCDHGRLWHLTIRTSDNTVQSMTAPSCGQWNTEDGSAHANRVAEQFLAMKARGWRKE